MTIREIIFAPQETKWAIGSDGAHTVCLLVSNKAVLGTALFGNTMSSSGPVFSSLFATYCSRSVPQNLGPPGFSSKRPRVVKRPSYCCKAPSAAILRDFYCYAHSCYRDANSRPSDTNFNMLSWENPDHPRNFRRAENFKISNLSQNSLVFIIYFLFSHYCKIPNIGPCKALSDWFKFRVY